MNNNIMCDKIWLKFPSNIDFIYPEWQNVADFVLQIDLLWLIIFKIIFTGVKVEFISLRTDEWHRSDLLIVFMNLYTHVVEIERV